MKTDGASCHLLNIRDEKLYVLALLYLYLFQSIQIPTLGPREEGKCPTHGTRSKFYSMIVAKNILIPVVFNGFSHDF